MRILLMNHVELPDLEKPIVKPRRPTGKPGTGKFRLLLQSGRSRPAGDLRPGSRTALPSARTIARTTNQWLVLNQRGNPGPIVTACFSGTKQSGKRLHSLCKRPFPILPLQAPIVQQTYSRGFGSTLEVRPAGREEVRCMEISRGIHTPGRLPRQPDTGLQEAGNWLSSAMTACSQGPDSAPSVWPRFATAPQ